MSTVGRNDPCPCGSGLKYKQCCEGKIRLNVRGRRGWMLGAIGIAVVAVVAWGLVRAQSRPAVPTGMGTPLSSTQTGAGAVASTPVTTTSTVTVGPGGTISPAPAGSAPITMTPGTGAMTTPTVGGPKAWDYDPVTNRHFDPGHGHWHDGPAPPPESRGTASSSQPSIGGVTTTPGGHAAPGTTPAPWTYDAAKNQHWDPGHGHWHQGPPPAGSR